MKPLLSVLMTLAGVAAAAGCSSPGIGQPSREPGWKDTGTPSLAMERGTRHNIGDKAIVWDGRGKKDATTS